MKFTILAGGYSAYVSTFVFDNETSSLNLLRNSYTGQNPSWLALDPKNRSILYTVNEIAAGALQSFTLDSQGLLSNPIDTVSSGGDSPAHAAVLSNGAIGVMNYNGGNGRIISTTADGLHFDNSAPVINFLRSGTVSHPHEVVEYDDELFIPDLGQDTIWTLGKSPAEEYTIQGSIPQPAGSGPRHIAFHEDRLYVLHELSSTLSVLTIPDSPRGVPQTLDTVSIIPENPPAGSKWQAAEILIPPTSELFPKSYIYVSNRNTGTNLSPTPGDSIAIYELVKQERSGEKLVLVDQVYTGLEQVRGMVFGNPEDGSGDYLVASGVVGTGGVSIFQRTDGGRNLKKIATNTEVPTRTGFVWL